MNKENTDSASHRARISGRLSRKRLARENKILAELLGIPPAAVSKINRRLDKAVNQLDSRALLDWSAVMSQIELKQQLVQLRQRSGLTQAQIAARLGITQAAVSKLESRKTLDFRLSAITKYIAALGGVLEIVVLDANGESMLRAHRAQEDALRLKVLRLLKSGTSKDDLATLTLDATAVLDSPPTTPEMDSLRSAHRSALIAEAIRVRRAGRATGSSSTTRRVPDEGAD